MEDRSREVTELVDRWSAGDESAMDLLIELAYDDLRQIAHRHLRNAPAQGTLGTTALVHELYMRLCGVSEVDWGGRKQFFSFCSKAMRRILIDYARRQGAAKRGGGLVRIPLELAAEERDVQAFELLALDDALTRLESRSERMARIVECRFFGGLSIPETAEAVGTSTRTVEREWARARAYLSQELSAQTTTDPLVD
jgi:RNA polymerase sigma factor (TIGR02999 family)